MFSIYDLNLMKHQPNPTIQYGIGMQRQYSKPPTDQTKIETSA